MSQTRMFDRRGLIEAFDAIGSAALANGVRLELAVDGGAALMLASNFRFATEDVDLAEIGRPWPNWLTEIVDEIARRNGWSESWLNDAVTFHLSQRADRAADHIEFGSFPRSGPAGLAVVVPTAAYPLALKLKAMRVMDAANGEREAADVRGLMRTLNVDADGAIAILRRYFPMSAADSGKQRFLLRHLRTNLEGDDADALRYLSEACHRYRDGQPWDIAMGDFLQQFYGTPTADARAAMLAEEPPALDDPRWDALVGGIAEYLFKRWAPDHPPRWIGDRSRYLDRPCFPHACDDPALMEYLTFASPAEFKSRYVMTDEEPLRRANTPRPVGLHRSDS